MKLNPLNFNPQKFNPFKKLLPAQDESGAGLASYDESVLQQGRFWMRTVTWSLIGTTVFGVAWLALARTEEIVVAPGQLEPIGSVQDIQMPVGGVADQILVKEGEEVKAGQGLIIVEAMKMENELKAPKDGVVGLIKATQGAAVDGGAVLCTVESVS